MCVPCCLHASWRQVVVNHVRANLLLKGTLCTEWKVSLSLSHTHTHTVATGWFAASSSESQRSSLGVSYAEHDRHRLVEHCCIAGICSALLCSHSLSFLLLFRNYSCITCFFLRHQLSVVFFLFFFLSSPICISFTIYYKLWSFYILDCKSRKLEPQFQKTLWCCVKYT